MSKLLFVLLMQLVTIEVVRVAAISLTIRPEHVSVNQDPQSVSFTCAADVALAGCQFRWRNHNNNIGPLLELSRGSQSRADPAHLDTSLTGYSYSGRGLGAGDCGVSLQVKDFKHWMVACRVRAETGGWNYAWAVLYAHAWAPLPHNLVTPREVVVLPGGEARFSLVAREPLGWCHFYPPPSYGELVFSQGPKSRHSTGRHTYIGAGPQSGQCGLAVTNVREEDNGWVRCYIATNSKEANGLMALVVARPPTAPTLSLTYTGTNVTATCAVQGSRPVAKIFWVLGDVIIRQDENDDTQAGALDEWRWPWMQGSIQQTLTLQLQPQHNGKDLKCRVSHIALTQPLEAKSTVSFVEPTMSTTPGITTSTTPGQKCIAANILDLLCQENRLQATQLANTSCPNEEVYAFRVREAGAAARTAEVLEEAAKAEKTAKAAAAEKAMNAAQVMEEVAKVSLEAARAHARAEAELEEVSKAEKTAKAAAAEKAMNAADVTYKLAEDAAKVSLEAARARARAEAELEAEVAKVSLEAARAHARAEEAWAKNAEEELQYERERRAST